MAERGTEREPGAAPIDPARDATLMKTNDPTALNGGPARHWFRSDAAAEPLPTPLRRAKLGAAIALWGVLAVGALMLAAGIGAG